jgi:hypothetical protein
MYYCCVVHQEIERQRHWTHFESTSFVQAGVFGSARKIITLAEPDS